MIFLIFAAYLHLESMQLDCTNLFIIFTNTPALSEMRSIKAVSREAARMTQPAASVYSNPIREN